MNIICYITYGSLLLSKLVSCSNNSDSPYAYDVQSAVYNVVIKQAGTVAQPVVNITGTGDRAMRAYGDVQNRSLHFVSFNFKSSTVITIIKKQSAANTAVILPARAGIGTIKAVAVNAGKQVSFKINRPGYFSVEFDDDLDHKNALMIFADSAERTTLIPNKGSDKVLLLNNGKDVPSLISPTKSIVYFGAGLHNIGYWNIPAHINQVYLASGAIVRGYLYARRDKGNPLTINGRGILSNEGWRFHYPVTSTTEDDYKKWYKTIEIRGGSNHLIEGITIVNSTSYNIIFTADNMQIRNVKINGFSWNNDAVTITGKNTTIDHCFVMVNDDAIIPYGSGLNVKNCVFWQLNNGSVFQLGWNVHNMSGQNIIKNCDVIHAEWNDPGAENIGFINAMNANNNADNEVIENFLVTDIYFDSPVLRFLDIRAARRFGSQQEQQTKSWTYKDFKFRNIHLKQHGNTPLIYLSGTEQHNIISGFSFQNIYVNGSKLLGDTDKKWSGVSNIHSANIKLF